jgi:hypothetical protein
MSKPNLNLASRQSKREVTYEGPEQAEFPLTVFAFGTGEDRHMKSQNVISKFSRACSGPKIVADGPDLLGKKVLPNTQDIVDNILEKLKTDSSTEGPLCVNLTGFSRGAITCIRVANELKKIKESTKDENLRSKLERLELNLFLIDPVAGLGEKKGKEGRVIPENVKNCVVVIQTDEMRREFKPQDRSRLIVLEPEKTNITFLPLYGNHSDSTKTKNLNMTGSPGLIWQTLFQFMTKNGTVFEHGMPEMAFKSGISVSEKVVPVVNPSDLLKLYEKLHREREAFLSSGKKFKFADSVMFRRTRSMNAELEFYVKDSSIFANVLERELMKLVYPRVFNYLFEQNVSDTRFPSHSDLGALNAEFEKLKDNHMDLFARLKNGGKLQKNGLLPDQPQGYALLTSLSTVAMLYPEMMGGCKPDLKMLQLEHLEQKIIDLTFRYERDKSHVRPFYHRSEQGRAHAIRKEMMEIMRNPPPSAEEKIEKITNMLKQHVQYLRNAHSRTKFLHYLEEIVPEQPLKLSSNIASEVIYYALTFVKEIVNFVGSFGYVGGAVLSGLGIFVRDIGLRLEDSLRTYESHPLKSAVVGVARLMQMVGGALKEHLGFRPLVDKLSDAIKVFRDNWIISINSKTLAPVLPRDSQDHQSSTQIFRENLEDLKKEPSQNQLLPPQNVDPDNNNNPRRGG